ncbi:DUF397 domain-containing protein [Actinokineospora pegani]|uniref:DUF397 domain-containing protein n=1 Tax=Actinokineospora pegani TaxID=2654637 RepID=UPI0012EA76F3|nr:DUF397 domain-containing protein [Actinokineospora pegani]
MNDTGWFKSSFTDASSNNCVECRISEGTSVRDSKNPNPSFHVPAAAWTAFIAGTKADRFASR